MIGPLPYIGGKRKIAAQIVALFPPHVAYVEPFAGGAEVFFYKPKSKVEVINDMDGEVVNLFRVMQRHPQELLRCLKYLLVSRKWFSLFAAAAPNSLTDIEQAARTLYLRKNAYAGLVKRQTYMHSVTSPRGFNPERLTEIIEAAYRRLQRVQIECLPYQEILKKFDRPQTLFYCDPPYFGRALYRYNFDEHDFEKLADNLRQIRGKFILSLNDVPQVRELFRDFTFREIAFPYTAQRSAGKRYPELLITNF